MTILIMIAIPNYRVANIKTIATEGLVISSEGRLQVHEYYAVTGKWLTQESALKNHQHSEIMTHNIEQGAVTMIFPQSKSLRLYGEQLTLRPVLFNNDRNMTFGWLCGYTQVSGLLPVGTNKTDIPAEHLMRLCRGDGDK
ncbi:MAG: pilin [Candidatus Thiodiazotropha sp. L084R]